MKPFHIAISGDLADAEGKPGSDLVLDLLEPADRFQWEFIREQQPRENDPSYQERLYEMEVTAATVAQSEGVIVCRPWVKASAFARGAERLVAIGRAGIGYDKIDLDACTEADVVVFNSPHGLTHSTASAAMLLILALSKRLHVQERILRQRRWDRQGDATGDDLTGQTLGIVGFGHTARELVRLLVPFHMRVLAYSPHADPDEAAQSGVALVGSIEDVFREADYLSLHNRLTARNHGMIGEDLLRLMKPTAYFINIARGELVDEPALVRCLREHRIAGAGLDVFVHEPLLADDPLLTLDNVILTPHWLCSTRQAGRATMAGVMDGMARVARGEVPENVLNRAVLERPGFRAKLERWAQQ